MVEYWSVGIRRACRDLEPHYSNTPLLQYSITPSSLPFVLWVLFDFTTDIIWKRVIIPYHRLHFSWTKINAARNRTMYMT